MTGSTAAPSVPAPFRLFRGKWAFWLPVAPLVALDLWSKAAVFAFIERTYPVAPNHAHHLVFDGWVRFDLVHWFNTGTVFGMLQGYNLPLVILRCVAVGVIVTFQARLPATARGLQFVLGLILAGALGNLYDNFTVAEPGYVGGVRDFLAFTFFPKSEWQWGFPAFNVADACITVGVFCLVLSILFTPQPGQPTAKPRPGHSGVTA